MQKHNDSKIMILHVINNPLQPASSSKLHHHSENSRSHYPTGLRGQFCYWLKPQGRCPRSFPATSTLSSESYGPTTAKTSDTSCTPPSDTPRIVGHHQISCTTNQ